MTTAFIGQPVSRVDGRQKVTGGATYAAEFDLPGQAHGADRAEHGRERPHRFDRQRGGGTGARRHRGLDAPQRAEACLSPAQGRPGPGCR